MPTNSSYRLQALAQSGFFRQRVKNALAKIAWQVINDGATSVQSKTYARAVLGNLDNAVIGVAGWIVGRTNLISSTISATISDTDGQVIVDTDALDAAMESQLATDWVGIAGG